MYILGLLVIKGYFVIKAYLYIFGLLCHKGLLVHLRSTYEYYIVITKDGAPKSWHPSTAHTPMVVSCITHPNNGGVSTLSVEFGPKWGEIVGS